MELGGGFGGNLGEATNRLVRKWRQIYNFAVALCIFIRPPTLADWREFVAAAHRSRALHKPWTLAPASLSQFRAYVKRMGQPANAAFLVCRRDNGNIIGVINITNIVLGSFRSGYLGYYAFAGHDGQGLMREGLETVVRHAFQSLKLHRLEANIQPGAYSGESYQ